MSDQLQQGRKYSDDERVGEQVSLLLGMLASQYSEAQTSAVVQLSRIGEPAVPHLIRALSEGPTAKDIARILGIIGSPTAVGALSKMLDEEGGRLSGSQAQHAAAEALGKIGSKEALDVLARNVHKGGVSAALSRFGTERIGALLKVLGSADPVQQATAARQLGEAKEARAVPALLNVLRQSPDDRARAAATDALAEIGDRAAIPQLKVLLGSTSPGKNNRWGRSDDEVHGRVIDALARLGGTSVIPDLLRETVAGNGDARSALVRMGDRAVPALADVLTKGDTSSQKVAADVIAEIKGGSRR